MAFFAFFVPCHKMIWILLLTLIGTGFSGFLLATALNSPNMLFGSEVGGSLTVRSSFIRAHNGSIVKENPVKVCLITK